MRVSTAMNCGVRPLRHNEAGATAIEFALVSPVLLVLMLGILETSAILFVQGMMETATFNASRLGKTGYVPLGVTREAAIREMIQARTLNMIDMDEIVIATRVYGDFSQIGDPEPFTDANRNGYYDLGETYTDVNGNAQWDTDMGAAGLGGAEDVVVYTVSYPWRFHTPLIDRLFGDNGTLQIAVRAVVKNEPYDA